jgi:tetratricopeptide (TPR) repeat protein
VSTPHYKAFISYSHRDERWARWLQRSLERYRVPRRLVGKAGSHGDVPARLRPVFRDREDLSSAADLTGRIKEELEKSEFLVVVCSPAAASSRWVNEEIRHFRQSGGEDRILALVVDGDPLEETGDGACFPSALVELPDGGRREPLAADVRRYADGKHLALLKIIAGLLGVRLDELRRRDAHRRLQRRLVWGAVSVVLMLLIGWLLYSQAESRAAAKLQRVNTEELLSYMLGDLRRLDPITGVESMVVEQESYGALSRRLALREKDNEALLQHVMDWREEGLDLTWNGELADAMEKFQASHAALIELHRRQGNTEQMLFELGQAEFYVGMVHVESGRPEMARDHWVRYGALTRRLLNREPNNPRYVMELSYTLMNLGALEQQFPVPDATKSLELLQAAVQYNQMALVLDPENREYRESLPTQLAWLADTRLMTCSLGEALKLRQESAELRRALVEEYPESADDAREYAYSLSGLAGVQQQIGLAEEAARSMSQSVDVLLDLHRQEPGNEDIEWQMLLRRSRLAEIWLSMGEFERAAEIIEPMTERIRELGKDPEGTALYLELESPSFALKRARLLIQRGEVEQGEQEMRSAVDRLISLIRAKPGSHEGLTALAWASFDYWERFGYYPPEAKALLPADFLVGPDSQQGCSMANLAARLAVVDGDMPLARRYVDYALQKGYFERDFIAFCKRYELCELP